MAEFRAYDTALRHATVALAACAMIAAMITLLALMLPTGQLDRVAGLLFGAFCLAVSAWLIPPEPEPSQLDVAEVGFDHLRNRSLFVLAVASTLYLLFSMGEGAATAFVAHFFSGVVLAALLALMSSLYARVRFRREQDEPALSPSGRPDDYLASGSWPDKTYASPPHP